MHKTITHTLLLISFFCTHHRTQCALNNPRFATLTIINRSTQSILLTYQSEPRPPEYPQTTSIILKMQPAESREITILTDLKGKAILYEVEEYENKFRITQTAILDTTTGNTLNICDTQDNTEKNNGE